MMETAEMSSTGLNENIFTLNLTWTVLPLRHNFSFSVHICIFIFDCSMFPCLYMLGIFSQLSFLKTSQHHHLYFSFPCIMFLVPQQH